jgi:hypothetical protein
LGALFAVLAADCAVRTAQTTSTNERTGNQLAASAIAPRGITDERGNMSGKVALNREDGGTVVRVAVGNEVDIMLQTIGPGSFGDPEVSSGSIQFLDVSLAKVRSPGGPTQVFRFRAVENGQTLIRIPHTADGPFSNPDFTITLSVE